MALSPPAENDARSTTVTDDRGWSPRLVLGLIAIMLSAELLSISYIMIGTALPSIGEAFETTQVAWLQTAFLLTGAVIAPLLGKLADMHGKKRVLVTCLLIAAVGATISATAPTYGLLIVGRVLFGFLMPCLFLGYSLIRDTFPPRTVAVSVSLLTTGLGLIAVPAPFLTGYLLDNHGFRSIFWFFLGGLLVSAVLTATVLPESSVRVRTRIDFLGAALLGTGIAGVLVAVSFGPDWGWTATSTVTFLTVGVALLVSWAVAASKVASPLVPLDVLFTRSVGLTTIGAGVAYGLTAIFGSVVPMMVMAPQALGLGYGWGLSAGEFAVFKLPLLISIVLAGLVVGVVITRGVKPRVALVAGLLLMAGGAALIALNHSSETAFMWLAAIFGIGQGMAYAAIPNLLIEAVSPELQATTASIVAVSQAIFPAVMSVVVFTLLNNSYIATSVQGATFYSSSGFAAVFGILAIVAAVGAAASYAIPKVVRQRGLAQDDETERVVTVN